MIQRLQNEKGAGVSILGLFMIAFMLLLGVLLVDYTRAVFVKNLHASYAQKAVQTAIKQQDGLGGLKPESAEVVVREYLQQRDGQIGNTQDSKSNRGKCDLAGNYPQFTIKYDNERTRGIHESKVYHSSGQALPTIEDRHLFYQNKYNTIQVEIVDTVSLWYYGIFGRPCTEIKLTNSAISVSSEDEFEIRK